MRGKILYIDLVKNSNVVSKLNENAFEISIFGKLGLGKMRNLDVKTQILVFKEFGVLKDKKSAPQGPKPEIWFRFWIFGPENWFSKILNQFFLFLSILISRPKNLKSAMSKTPTSTFSLQNSNFRFKFFFYRNPKFRIRFALRRPLPTWEVDTPNRKLPSLTLHKASKQCATSAWRI